MKEEKITNALRTISQLSSEERAELLIRLGIWSYSSESRVESSVKSLSLQTGPRGNYCIHCGRS